MHLGNEQQYCKQHKKYLPYPVQNERRLSHTWSIGKTGVGKSTSLIRWALDDINNGSGIAFFDPHGDAVETLLQYIPASRREDVIWFAPFEFSISINPFDTIPKERHSFVASAIVDCFKSVWGYTDFATPTLDMFLYNSARALIDMPDGSLFGIKYLLTSKTYRKRVISYIQDPVIAEFWKQDFEEHMPEREQRERTLSTLNKIGALISDPTIRNLIANPKGKINFQEVINTNKILLISLPHGELGIEKSSLIGSLILSQLHLAALSNDPDADRKPFHIFADECHHFGPSTLCEMLSGIRKFGVSLTLANQYLEQLPHKLKHALLGTTGTIVAYQLGAFDAQTLEPEFKLYPDDYSLCELDPYRAYIRSGLTTRYLSMPPLPDNPNPNQIQKLKNLSRSKYGADIAATKRRIEKFMTNI